MRFIEVAMPAAIVAAVGLLAAIGTGLFDSSSGPVLIHGDPAIHGAAPSPEQAAEDPPNDLLVGRSAGPSSTDVDSGISSDIGSKVVSADTATPDRAAAGAPGRDQPTAGKPDVPASAPSKQEDAPPAPYPAARLEAASPQQDGAVTQLRARVDGLVQQAQKVQAETEAREAGSAAALATSRQHEAALEQRVAALQQAATDTAQQHEKLVGALAEANRRKGSSDDAVARLQVELATMRQEDQSLRRQVASLQADAEQRRTRRDDPVDKRRAVAVPRPNMRMPGETGEHKRLVRELAALKHIQLVGELAALKREAAGAGVRTR